MAAIRNPRAAVGSAQWIKDEREQLNRLVEQDVEEFGYSARNELEWLNEHMAEIFSSNQMNVTDVFKTPGKLRGKTPRTARKPDSNRAPLTDLFAPNPQSVFSPARSTPFFQKVSKIAVAPYNDSQSSQATVPLQTWSPKIPKHNTDSGYHGMTEDEAEDIAVPTGVSQAQVAANAVATSTQAVATSDSRTTDSFVSAQEVPDAQPATVQEERIDEDDDATVLDDANPAHDIDEIHNEISIHEDDPEVDSTSSQETPTQRDATDSASYASSPERPLPRKSSLNFASLPPRETLAGKTSMGFRHSQYQPTQLQGNQQTDTDTLDRGDALAAAHSKTTTQLLHEKINMLGQTREPRPSKSIPSMYPQLPQNKQAHQTEAHVDDDDSWIAPIGDRKSIDLTMKVSEQEARMDDVIVSSSAQKLQKSTFTSLIPSPTKTATAPGTTQALSALASVLSEPGKPTTTPTASPRKTNDGPLSASKARFYSVLKSAKGMFASSAGASAQAKLENTNLHKAPSQDSLGSEIDTSKIPGGFADDAASVRTAKSTVSRPLSAFFSPSKEKRKTRSSTETDRRAKPAEEHETNDFEKALKAAKPMNVTSEAQGEKSSAASREEKAQAGPPEEDQETSQHNKGMPSNGKLRAPGRLGKPTRQAPTSTIRPVPVNIRVASQAQRLGSVQPSASTNSLAETTQTPGNRPPSAAGRPGMNRAGSANPPSGSRLKVLEAAARKKEQEEKAAAKKAEQKKEIERKRAAKQEEERRLESERRAEEQRKLQEARAAAQKQAEQRKLEQQRREAAAAKAKADAEMAENLEREQRERARAVAAAQRGDAAGTIRQLNKSSVVQDLHANKAVKRPLQKDAEEAARASTMNRGVPSYQQQDAKRRRTDDEEGLEQHARPSTMAPPKRPSAMIGANKFPHGYAHAPPPAAHHAQNNIYKASLASQPTHPKAGPVHPTETIKLSNARIPFAEPNHPKTPTAAPVFKTPARPPQPFSAHTKPSPAYPPGDSIALPEIESDEDSDDSSGGGNAQPGFRAPSWVASPALRDLLTQQQLVDPESVFGPIAALNMDDVFRGGNGKSQDRIRRYRERGESALWHESGDAVTSAEKRRDREARERVVREGGWSFTRDI